jgi:hypothetical protein
MTLTATIAAGLAIIAGFCCNTAIAGCNNSNVKGAYGHLATASVPAGGGEAGPGVSRKPVPCRRPHWSRSAY